MPAAHVCPTPGCPQLQPCPTHKRPSSHARGYDRAHRRIRAHWALRINAGAHVDCWRCGQPIAPTEPWDLGHDDDRTITRGPEHARQCNRSAAGKASHTR